MTTDDRKLLERLAAADPTDLMVIPIRLEDATSCIARVLLEVEDRPPLVLRGGSA